MRSAYLMRVSHAVATLVLALVATPAPLGAADPIPYEIGIAEREAGHLRGLLEKLAKQNVLYQLHLGGVNKQIMQETTAEIDRVLVVLEKGSAAYSVAPPLNRAIRDQLGVFDGRWGRVRRAALASPYEYLRNSNDLMPTASRIGDPLFIRAFDRIVLAAIEEAETLMLLYKKECDATGYAFCDAASQAGFFNMLVQRVAKQLVLASAGIEAKSELASMRANRDILERSFGALAESPILMGARAETRGSSAAFVSSLWEAIEAGWQELRFEADAALEGHIEGLDIQRMLKVQRNLVEDLDRLRAALSRYAEAVQEA